MKLCLYFNIPSIYREEIFTRLNKEFECEWFFEKSDEVIEHFDISKLHKTSILNTKRIGYFYWTVGLISLLNKDYSSYLMIGATRNISLYAFLFLKKIFFREKKVILWTHGYYGKENWVVKNIFKRPLLRMADSLLLYGNYARKLMLKDGFNPDKVFTLHNSLAYSKQLIIRKSIKTSMIYQDHFCNNNPVLIFIGRLTPIKQLGMILDAMALLSVQGECYNMVFVGDGTEKEGLEQKTEELGLNRNVWFYGACYDEVQNAELVFNADLCVAPGNVGLTAIHCLMFGCPVITHNDFKWQMPEFEVIIPNKTGAFFERGNVSSLADSISNWFKLQSGKRNIVRSNCCSEIDESWTPDFQMKILNKVLS